MRACAMQRHATPCNAMQRHATRPVALPRAMRCAPSELRRPRSLRSMVLVLAALVGIPTALLLLSLYGGTMPQLAGPAGTHHQSENTPQESPVRVCANVCAVHVRVRVRVRAQMCMCSGCSASFCFCACALRVASHSRFLGFCGLRVLEWCSDGDLVGICRAPSHHQSTIHR
jgi:hypothetical protein